MEGDDEILDFSYYSEEQTFNVPSAKTQVGNTVAPHKVYSKGLKVGVLNLTMSFYHFYLIIIA